MVKNKNAKLLRKINLNGFCILISLICVLGSNNGKDYKRLILQHHAFLNNKSNLFTGYLPARFVIILRIL